MEGVGGGGGWGVCGAGGCGETGAGHGGRSRRRVNWKGSGTMRLENKVGIVTAAASGMGRAGATRFAREGAAVGVVDIDQAGVDAVVSEITTAGGRALGLVGDLRQDDFARSIVRRTANAFGGLHFFWKHVR